VQLWSDVGAPYETALARFGQAEACRAAGREDSARLELRAAQSILERIGARPVTLHDVAVVTSPATESQTAAPAERVFRREGDTWSITFDGQAVRLRDLKGLRYLARLLAEPGRDFLALDLVALESGVAGSAPAPDSAHIASALGDAGAHLDARAKEMYRRRLAEVEDDIESAERLGDGARAAQARRERDFLSRELSRAVGLGGRDRVAGSPAERARASTTRALRQAIARIREHHPRLADHLDRAVKTGTYCSYQPPDARGSGWRLWAVGGRGHLAAVT
jgi:hypothetical protein